MMRVALGKTMEASRHVIGFGLPTLGFLILLDQADGYRWSVAVLVFVALNWVTHWYNHRLVPIYCPRRIVEGEDVLCKVVTEQARLAGLPVPKIYENQAESLNAYAAGRSSQHAVIVVNSGLRCALDSCELGAVLAHELAHVRNRDALIITATVTIVGAVLAASILTGLDGWVGAVALLLPAVSWVQELRADAAAARNISDSHALVRALRKLFNVGLFTSLLLFPFHTHPPTAVRIWHLRFLAQGSA